MTTFNNLDLVLHGISIVKYYACFLYIILQAPKAHLFCVQTFDRKSYIESANNRSYYVATQKDFNIIIIIKIL